jgi:hypothetical protein
MKRGAYGVHVSCAAELANEAPSGLQSVPHAGDHFLGLVHPMKGSVSEDGIEERFETKRLPVHYKRLQAALPGCFNLSEACIYGIERATVGGYFFAERAIAATQVEDEFLGPGGKQR